MVQKIAAAPAIRLRDTCAQKPRLPGFLENLGREEHLLLPVLDVGLDLPLEEAPRGGAEVIMAGREYLPPITQPFDRLQQCHCRPPPDERCASVPQGIRHHQAFN
jgi:hypothetical protein